METAISKINRILDDLQEIKRDATGKDKDLIEKHADTCIDEVSWFLSIFDKTPDT